MSHVPTLAEARELLGRYNKEAFHLRHAEIVSGVMGWFAQQYDPENVEYWKAVGMLHDLDFEQWPEQHCVKCQELMREADIDESIIRACASHGYGIGDITSEFPPERQMEKILFAVDELTGLIGAAAIMRPSKSVADIEVSSVKKKFKDKKFAAGCSREVIAQGAELLGWDLDQLLGDTLAAMQAVEAELAEPLD